MSNRDYWNSGNYRPAAICRRGHPVAVCTTVYPVSDRCPDCGAKVLTACEKCGGPIQGVYKAPGVMPIEHMYRPPAFCTSCGSPHPWASRDARIHELENILDEQGLDEHFGARLEVCRVRRRFNEAVLKAVYLEDGKVKRAEFTDVFAALSSRPSSNKWVKVPPTGFEPVFPP
jgi:predicted RNA-binding Zn-ribbon protein involved in translation (DUF1610 family)